MNKISEDLKNMPIKVNSILNPAENAAAMVLTQYPNENYY